uniref:Retrovirus-related Pol polyprotein from transposon TNT 1-94 n=1 Tax=Tanacetum cinerariifolium TaxID=118510 RepID=A0A6L2JKG0_TANCI|nr:retrovirus-related Pol polyprotein from transposon TNT 1-94 [Tanacetum cinerariifolium]
MGTVRFENDHVAAILGFGDLQRGNILITRVYFLEGLGHNLFSIGQFCNSDLEVAFRRNACFVRNLVGVDLLKGDRSTNLYTINLHEMVYASLIYLMARASSTKSWLWHQCLSHLNYDTINNLSKNDLVSGLPKFKYHKEYLCPSCEKGKSKRVSHPPKPVPNSRQRLHLLHMDLCGPMRFASINGKRYVLVIVEDYSRYTWSPVIIIRINNGTEFKNQALTEYFDSVGISHQMSSVRTPQQNGVVERRNRTKLDILFLHVFGALCYPKNDREDIGMLGAKGNIGFFIGYSADSCAYRVYNQRTKKIMETVNVSFDELSAMAFEQRSSKPRLQSMTFGQINLGLDLAYASSTITSQQPTKGELDLLFKAMYDDFIGGQPSAAQRTITAAQAQQICQTSTTSTSIADSAPTPTNSSSQATNFPNSSQDVDELRIQQQHVQQQGNQAHLQSKTIEDNVPNAMFDAHTFVNPFANPSTAKPTEKHLKKVKRIFRHLQGTVNMGLWYTKDSGFKLTGFSDADYAGCKDTFKSTSGGAQFLGEKLLTDYGFSFNKIPICCDLKLAIAISCNPVQHSRTKHIAVRYHFIKEHVEKGTIELYFVKTDYQLADLFTKALLADRFNYFVRRLGMRSLSP